MIRIPAGGRSGSSHSSPQPGSSLFITEKSNLNKREKKSYIWVKKKSPISREEKKSTFGGCEDEEVSKAIALRQKMEACTKLNI